MMRRHQLDSLADDFNNLETEAMLKDMPNSHAPGPDGFNGLFVKKCWPIMKSDFLRMTEDLCNDSIDISSLNSSHIALIPKRHNPEAVDDYRPIFLLNYSLKCITKLMSTRLQIVILLIHANQFVFIKGRAIQDCLAWAFQFFPYLSSFRT